MCKYSVLSKRTNAVVRYCHDCKTYNIVFNNLLMNFAPSGLEGFKSNLVQCYETNVSSYCPEQRDLRNITFNTRLDGLQFLFSTVEVGELLALIQEAELAEMMLEKQSS